MEGGGNHRKEILPRVPREPKEPREPKSRDKWRVTSDEQDHEDGRPVACRMERGWEESNSMRCATQGCPGEYEERKIVHTVKHRGSVVVIDHVPADVCSMCGDVLLTPDTVGRIEKLLKSSQKPAKAVPLYEFA